MTLLLSLVARLVRAHRIPLAPGTLSRILVVDLNSLGDMLLASLVFRALRQAFPSARIDALVYEIAAPTVRINPFLDHVHTIAARSVWGGFLTALRVRRERYDLLDAIESLVPSLLSDLTFPAHMEDQYAQRLRHGLSQYYAHNYRSHDFSNSD